MDEVWVHEGGVGTHAWMRCGYTCMDEVWVHVHEPRNKDIQLLCQPCKPHFFLKKTNDFEMVLYCNATVAGIAMRPTPHCRCVHYYKVSG